MHRLFLLGALYICLAIVTDGTYALLAGRLCHYLRSQMRGRRSRYFSGTVYICLGIGAALATSDK